jgi:hypothetical protein
MCQRPNVLRQQATISAPLPTLLQASRNLLPPHLALVDDHLLCQRHLLRGDLLQGEAAAAAAEE